MKKAIKINLHGTIFHIDEDAYEKLKKYLDSISLHFSDKAEGEEIMNDIESRIAELFLEKLKNQEDVISLKLVSEVTEIMGDPKDFVDTGEDSDREYSYSRTSGRRARRLYRDPENSVIGGVCSGLGAYFNIDPLIIRILFVVFVFSGASLFIYLILWIVIPKAETSAQKLEMRGEPVTVSNIEKKVREEFESAKENVKKAANSESVKRTKRAANNFFLELGKILLVFIKIILILIGSIFIIGGIGIIIGIFTGTFMGLNFFPFADFDFTLGELLSPFTDPTSVTLLVISVSLLLLIPIFAMLYGIIKVLFSIKTRNRGLTVGAVTLWFVALVMVIGILAFETSNYSDAGKFTSESNIVTSSDTLYIEINDRQRREFEHHLAFDWEWDRDSEWFITEKIERIYGKVDLDIEASGNNQFTLEVEKRSKGKTWEEADSNASRLHYSFNATTNTLTLNPYFYIEGSQKWRFPDVDLTLRIPEGKYVYLQHGTREILDNIYNVDHISDWRMGGKLWLMTEDGLEWVRGDEE